MKRIFLISLLIASASVAATASSGTLSRSPGQDDPVISKIISLPGGDRIPDYSRMGYRWGDREIPSVPVVKEISAPADGSDATALIQNAIDSMEGSGAVLLKAGTFNVYGTIRLNRSGVVIRGEGQERTTINAAGTKQRSLFVVGTPGGLKINRDSGSRTRIADEYVPYGALCIPVVDPGNFKPGDRIIVHETHNQAWIKAIGMDRIMQFKDYYDRCVKQWTPEEYSYEYERVVSRIEGNMLWLDAPIILALYPEYGGGEVYKYSCNRIEECGIESLSAVSEFDPSVKEGSGEGYFADELHAWRFVEFDAAEHCWMRDCSCKHFGYSLATTGVASKNITVADCRSSAPVSRITGARRYGLDCCGQLALFIRCHLDNDRHGMVTHVSCAGPNAYVACEMTNALEDAGPHNNWGVGTLHDCCKTSQDINVQDRQGSGTGHGWAGASIVMWNCEARRICAQSVWGVHNNYVVGCVADKWNGWFGEPREKMDRKDRDRLADGLPADYQPRPDGIWVSHGKKVKPASLYAYQMERRRAAGIKAVPDEYYRPRHEMVDLGLSVKWASCNIDAASPTECGGYYSWGEVETKSDYTYKTYKWAAGTDRTLTKYCDNPDFGHNGFTDDKKRLDPEDDVACVKWGDGWRMPTAEELAELLGPKCRWEYVRIGGMECYRVTGPNGNSIVLPMGGDMSSSQPLPKPNRFNDGATYNSSSLSAKKEPFGARGCYMYSGAKKSVDLRRAGGRMVRAVHD